MSSSKSLHPKKHAVNWTQQLRMGTKINSWLMRGVAFKRGSIAFGENTPINPRGREYQLLHNLVFQSSCVQAQCLMSSLANKAMKPILKTYNILKRG